MTDFYVKGEHGAESHWSHVEYDAGIYWDEQRGTFVDASYLVPGLGGLELEEIATLLAERVERNHPGKGRDAFESARMQLLTRDYNGEWEDLQRKIRAHRMWGGPVPAAVLIPDEINPREWRMVITDAEGRPSVYGVKEKDILPPPEEGVNARRGPYGWEHQSTPQQAQRNRHERRREQAALRGAR
jgi:hypothetical protein